MIHFVLKQINRSQAADGYLTDLWDQVPPSCPLEAYDTNGDIGHRQVFVPIPAAESAAAAAAAVDLPRDEYFFSSVYFRNRFFW